MARLSTSLSALLLIWVRNQNYNSVQSFTIPPLSSAVSTQTTSKGDAGTVKKTQQLSKQEIRFLQDQAEADLRKNHDNEAWNALFVSCPERPDPIPIVETEGAIPADFPPGSYLRLGPNGADVSEGFFDGDGMIHCITFPPQSNDDDNSPVSTYSATYLDTLGRQLEKASGGTKKFKGTLGGVPRGFPMIKSIMDNAVAFRTLQAQKDTCNTAIAEHGGRLLALMEQCPPTEFEIGRDGRIRTLEASTSLNGALDRSTPISGGALSAHGRTCPITGDRVHLSYRSDARPFLRLDVFSPGFALKESIGIDIPSPIFSHDVVLTENYVVVMDLPLTLRTSRILRDRFPVEYEPDHPARIGLVPRGGMNGATTTNDEDILWFDCEPGVVLHSSNAWETDNGNTVIVQGFRGEPTAKECYLEQFAPSYFYEYSIDLKTGVVTEQILNPREIVEFPIVNENLNGQECSSCYAVTAQSVGGPLEVFAQPKEGVTFGSVVKLATIPSDTNDKGDVLGRYVLPERWYLVAEPTVVPKRGSATEGEYVLLIASHVPEGVNWKEVASDFDGCPLTSKVMLLDGDDLDAGAVYSATLPYHIPYGLHSGFVDWEHMK